MRPAGAALGWPGSRRKLRALRTARSLGGTGHGVPISKIHGASASFVQTPVVGAKEKGVLCSSAWLEN